MKIKLYTKGHDIDLLKEIDNGGQFTSEEHAYIMKKEFSDSFETKEKILHWSLSGSPHQLTALAFLIEHINQNGFTNILSLGSGTCTFEYLLKYALSPEARVVAADFDLYLIKRAKALLPGIIPVRFDFLKDDVKEIQDKILQARIDLTFFFGSSYVMDDEDFISLFKRLKKIGVRQIIDFQGGYLNFTKLINFYFFWPLKESLIIRKIFRKPLLKGAYLGKFHGYARTRGELRKLYKKANLSLIRETSVGPYNYVAICNC